MQGQEGSTTDFRPSRIPEGARNPVDPMLGLAKLLDTEKGHRTSEETSPKHTYIYPPPLGGAPDPQNIAAIQQISTHWKWAFSFHNPIRSAD